MTLLSGQSSNLHGKIYSILLILFHRRTMFNAAYTRGDRRHNRSAQLSAQPVAQSVYTRRSSVQPVAPIAKRATVGATGCADGCGKLSGNVNQLSSAPHLCTTSQFDFVKRLLKGFQMEEEIEDDWLFLAAAAACVTYYN